MKLQTNRLSLCTLNLDHAPFMFNLTNSPQWKQFIGDRSIHSIDDAIAYVQKIIDTPHTTYWVIEEQETGNSIGVISFMKRDYLEHFDIGFALLPDSFGSGFAFEAASAVLAQIKKDQSHNTILATTLPSNTNSIKLLEKLGFSFTTEIQSADEVLQLYRLSLRAPDLVEKRVL